ncbi:hypothetical protein [Algoriphagus hitonicola]|uniref:tRNA (Guanine-N1)-methyltransferase n=1 Tax=Algoriphagus hitonicola TaxID=435880 RepID=A0A1I2QG69_9BACT|nr:hypothetical protein [Algoriphagus hitonicola]SFG27402.1 hypothetical protein SAMN04487988_102268 [Algoriphagus hitonicola]
MKKFNRSILFFILFSIAFNSVAQNSSDSQNSLQSGTINNQFDYIYEVSNNFQEYKVVKRTNLDQLKTNILDSMQTMRAEVIDLKSQIRSQNDSTAAINQRLAQSEIEKQEAIDAKDNFSFLGIGIHKAVYSSIMWILVAVLASALAFFSFQYFKSFKKIQKAQRDLADLQEEFDQHRKNTLERERKLKRELIDAQMGKS